MDETKSSISHAQSYQEIGEFWDNHDLNDFWDQTEPAELEVDINTEATYYPIEVSLAKRLRVIAAQRGVSAETLLNLWVQEKMAEVAAASSASPES
jgi:hypothetical protein